MQHRGEFVVQPRLDGRVLRQQVPGPRQRLRRRLVSGHENRHHLIANLLWRHTAGLVARGDQAGQQIFRLGLGRPPALHQELIDFLVKLVENSLGVAGYEQMGEPPWNVKEIQNARLRHRLIGVDASLDDIDDTVGVGREHGA